MKTVVVELELLEVPELRIHFYSGLKHVESEKLLGGDVYKVVGANRSGQRVVQLVNKLDNHPTCVFTNNYTSVTCVETRHKLYVSKFELMQNVIMFLDMTLTNQCNSGNDSVIKLKKAFEDVIENGIG